MNIKRIVVTGSLAYDYIMRMPGKFKDHILPDKIHILNVSFIMKTFQREYGGTGGNIAYSLSLFDVPTLLVGAIGDDAADYLKHLEKLNSLDTSGIVECDGQTARGFVTTDGDDNQIWGFYEGAMKFSSKINLKDYLKKDDLLVIAPNDPIAMMNYVNDAVEMDIPYLFDPAFNIPHFDLTDLKFAISNANILIGNDYEVHLIKKRLKEIKSINSLESVKILVTTLGPKGAQIKQNDQTYTIPAAKPENTSDPTGAGDAFRSGLLAGLYYKKNIFDSGKLGALTSVYTVEKYGTQTHQFNKKGIVDRFEQNYHDKLTL